MIVFFYGYSYCIHEGFDQEDEGSKCEVSPGGWKAVQLLYSSDITVKPEHWNPKKAAAPSPAIA